MEFGIATNTLACHRTRKWYQFNDEIVTTLASLHTPRVGKDKSAPDTNGFDG